MTGRLVLLVTCVLLAGFDVRTLAAAQAYCPRGKVIDFDLPGIPMGSDYKKVRSKVPASAGCDKPDDGNGCEFTDEFGQTIYFTPYGVVEGDRTIGMKEAFRKAGGPLPLAIKWSDSPEKVAKKSNAAGFATQRYWTSLGEQVDILNTVCGEFRGDTWLEFKLKFGRLQSVKHSFNWT